MGRRAQPRVAQGCEVFDPPPPPTPAPVPGLASMVLFVASVGWFAPDPSAVVTEVVAGLSPPESSPQAVIPSRASRATAAVAARAGRRFMPTPYPSVLRARQGRDGACAVDGPSLHPWSPPPGTG